MEKVWKAIALILLAPVYLISFLVVTYLTETWTKLLEEVLGL